MPFKMRFSTTVNGAVQFTGNTLGLSTLDQGTTPPAIGTSITTHPMEENQMYSPGTTDILNSSSAVLYLPPTSQVLYAELLWGGSFKTEMDLDYSPQDPPILLQTSLGMFPVTPDPATTMETQVGNVLFYGRSAIVTDLVKNSGGGIYTLGRDWEKLNQTVRFNDVGWTLMVVYENSILPLRNLTIYVEAEKGSLEREDSFTEIIGFVTPNSGPIKSRLFLSAWGQSCLSKDGLLFAATKCVQGFFDQRGNFGLINHSLGNYGEGNWQGWDISNIDISTQLTHSQTSAIVQGKIENAPYLINGLGLQIDINGPQITVYKQFNTNDLFVGDILTVQIQIKNEGSLNADFVFLKDTLLPGTSLIQDSVLINDKRTLINVHPDKGIGLGTIVPQQTSSITYQCKSESREAANSHPNYAWVSYQYHALPGGIVSQSEAISNQCPLRLLNRSPVARPFIQSIQRNQPWTGQLEATDPDGDSLTFTILTPPMYGLVTIQSDGSFIYTPNDSFKGTDRFIYLVDDGYGGSDVSTGTFLVDVDETITDPVNKTKPIFGDLTLTTEENTPIIGILANYLTDVTLLYHFNTPPKHGTVTVNLDGTFIYTPFQQYVGSDFFTVLIEDQQSHSDTSLVKILVTEQSDPIWIFDSHFTTHSAVPLIGRVETSISLEEKLTFSLQTSPEYGTVVWNEDGTFTYTSDANFIGNDSFIMIATDEKDRKDHALMQIKIVPAKTPIVPDRYVMVEQNTPFNGLLLTNPPIDDSYEYVVIIPPAHGKALVYPDSSFTYTPQPDFTGEDFFQILVKGNKRKTSFSTITIVVNPADQGSLLVRNLKVATKEGEMIKGAISYHHDDPYEMIYLTLLQPPLYGDVKVNAAGAWRYRPDLGFTGDDFFTVLVTDEQGHEAVAQVELTVGTEKESCLISSWIWLVQKWKKFLNRFISL